MDTETKALMREMAREAADEAVTRSMVRLGIDDPIEFQKDAAQLRTWRLRAEKIEDKATLTVVALVVTAVAGAIWAGLGMG